MMLLAQIYGKEKEKVEKCNGNKKNYNNQKALFMAYIAQAPATVEYKVLQLHK